jgi:hypothetical protein
MSKEATIGQFDLDPHWGALPKGELARLLGAGDPKEITSGPTPIGHEELGE